MSDLLDAAKDEYSNPYPCGNDVFTQVVVNRVSKVVCLRVTRLDKGAEILKDGTVRGSYSESNTYMSIEEANGLYNSLTEMGFYNTSKNG